MGRPRAEEHQGDCQHIAVWTRAASSKKWTAREEKLKEALSSKPETLMTVVLVRADAIRACRRCKHVLSSSLKMPEFWWMPACRKIEGYFGCEETYDEAGQFDGHNSWIRFIAKQMRKPREHKPDGKDYCWEKVNIFARWLPSAQSTVVIFDGELASRNMDVAEVVKASLSAEAASLDPFYLHMCVVEQVVEMQNTAVWSIRDLVRDRELSGRPSKDGSKPEPEYPLLHEIARHAIHVSETLDLAIQTVVRVMHHHDGWREEQREDGGQDVAVRRLSRKVQNRLDCYEHMLRALRYRSASNKERLLNEIQLAYNTVAQWDSSVAVQIGHATQRDSSAMRLISVLTLTFLPATFVSAIFSTSFFSTNNDDGRWEVSDKFWLYWVFAIPVTILTIVCWFVGQKYLAPPAIGGPTTASPTRTLSTYIRELKVSPTGKTDMV